MNKSIVFKLILVSVISSIFLTKCEKDSGLPRDGDGNEYDTVVIGTQVWLAENLKTTKYNNGVSIPLVTENTQWASTTSAAFCWYDNEIKDKNEYGALYNWYTAKPKQLCPVGYHVATKEDWSTLISFLGGEPDAGGKLKEIGTSHWQSPNDGASNESKFTALPGGGRNGHEGGFGGLGEGGSWWISSPEYDDINSWRVDIYKGVRGAYIKAINKKFGLSIRCIKD